MASDVTGRSGGLKLAETAVLVVVGVAGVVFAFTVFHAIVGWVWTLVKLAVIVVVVAALWRFFAGRRR